MGIYYFPQGSILNIIHPGKMIHLFLGGCVNSRLQKRYNRAFFCFFFKWCCQFPQNQLKWPKGTRNLRIASARYFQREAPFVFLMCVRFLKLYLVSLPQTMRHTFTHTPARALARARWRRTCHPSWKEKKKSQLRLQWNIHTYFSTFKSAWIPLRIDGFWRSPRKKKGIINW